MTAICKVACRRRDPKWERKGDRERERKRESEREREKRERERETETELICYGVLSFL